MGRSWSGLPSRAARGRGPLPPRPLFLPRRCSPEWKHDGQRCPRPGPPRSRAGRVGGRRPDRTRGPSGREAGGQGFNELDACRVREPRSRGGPRSQEAPPSLDGSKRRRGLAYGMRPASEARETGRDHERQRGGEPASRVGPLPGQETLVVPPLGGEASGGALGRGEGP